MEGADALGLIAEVEIARRLNAGEHAHERSFSTTRATIDADRESA